MHFKNFLSVIMHIFRVQRKIVQFKIFTYQFYVNVHTIPSCVCYYKNINKVFNTLTNNDVFGNVINNTTEQSTTELFSMKLILLLICNV